MTQQVAREDKPVCFGREDDPKKEVCGWNPNSAECAGGPDPTYVHPGNGSRVRDRCLFFQSCGSTVQAKKMEKSRALIAPQSLVKPSLPTPSVPTLTPQKPAEQPQAPAFITQFAHQLAMQKAQREQQALAQQQAQQQQQMMAQQQMMQMPVGYQQMMPVNYHMPAYLSAPEPLVEGGFWGMMGRTVFRSMGKSLGHSIAHLFDTVPLGYTKPPSR